jgi:hypothetical protein
MQEDSVICFACECAAQRIAPDVAFLAAFGAARRFGVEEVLMSLCEEHRTSLAARYEGADNGLKAKIS